MAGVIELRPEWLLDSPPSPPRRGGVIRLPAAESRAIDLPGVTLLPGLIDAHVHLTLCGCGTPRQTMMREDNETLLLRAAENARRALLAGITTVRDCGDRGGITFALRHAIERGIVPGPGLILCGPPLTPPRGHCYFMGGEVEGRDGIPQGIAANIARGADFIKVMATGGGMTPGTNSIRLQFTVEELELFVTESARHGRYVAAHAHSADAIRVCVAAGVRTIEHASFVDDHAIQQLAEKQVTVVPTNVPAMHAVREGRTLGLAREVGLDSQQFLDRRASALEAFAHHGVPVLAGSDAGATGTPFDSLLGEVELLAAGPFTNLQAIAAATTLAAKCLGLPDSADWLGVRGNAAEDITALRRPVLVVRSGTIIREERL